MSGVGGSGMRISNRKRLSFYDMFGVSSLPRVRKDWGDIKGIGS